MSGFQITIVVVGLFACAIAGFFFGYQQAKVDAFVALWPESNMLRCAEPKLSPLMVQTGDTLVVSYAGVLTKEQRAAIEGKVRYAFATAIGLQVLVLDGGLTLQQYRASDLPKK